MRVDNTKGDESEDRNALQNASTRLLSVRGDVYFGESCIGTRQIESLKLFVGLPEAQQNNLPESGEYALLE